MRANEFLIERIINVHTPEEKQRYADTVWDILQKSYAKLPGGFATASSPEELIRKSSLWKLVTRGGEVTTVSIYKDQFGRKTIAGGTDGTTQGKKDYIMLRDEDHRRKRTWSEVSGAPEAMLQKMGGKPIPAKYAPILTRKHILSFNDDGYHYTRLISGHPHEKIMYGTVNLTQQQAEELAAAGITIHDLPSKIG